MIGHGLVLRPNQIAKLAKSPQVSLREQFVKLSPLWVKDRNGFVHIDILPWN
jgi:hypothetical protein